MKLDRQEQTSPVIKQILGYLRKSIKKDRVSHAYLFEGPNLLVNEQDYSDKRKVSLWFAKRLEHSGSLNEIKNIQKCKCRSCQDIEKNQHPDVMTIVPIEEASIFPEDKHIKKLKKISINQIRELKKHLNLSSFNSSYKIAIIDPAEKMTEEAMNALLKILEEPMGRTVLILIVNTSSNLPDTIVSRCEKIKFRPIPLDKISDNFIHQDYINVLKKPFGDIFKFLEKISKNDKEIISFLDFLLLWFRKKLIKEESSKDKSPKNFIKILKETQKIKNLILTTNVNKRLALENLILTLYTNY